MYNRSKIESSILGALIFHNGYPHIAHILTANNFSSVGTVRNRELFSVISSMFPDRPIDLLSLTQEISLKYPDQGEIMDTLCNAGQGVCANTSVVYWAFLLLQIDITEKLTRQLVDWKSQRERDLEHTEAGALTEILENVIHGTDVFEVIDGAILYFKHLNMQDELKQTLQFYEDLSEKVKNTKKMNSIHTALNYLIALTDASPEVEHHCKTFVGAIAMMITNNATRPEYTEAVNLINNQ